MLNQVSNFWFERTGDLIENHVIDPSPSPTSPARSTCAAGLVVVRRTRPGHRGDRPRIHHRFGLEPSTSAPAPSAASAFRRTCARASNWTSHSSRLRPRPNRAPMTRTSISPRLRTSLGRNSPSSPGDQPGPLPCRRRVRARAWDHHRRHQVRVRPTGRRQADPHRRGSHARFLAVLAARRLRAGRRQPSFDKQYVRDYLAGLGWDKQPPAPKLPDEIARKTAEKYREAQRRLTGQEVT